MLRFLHTADLHLDAPFPELGRSAEQRRQDQLFTFERLVSLAIRNGAQLFLVAGDLFATPRPDAAVRDRVVSHLKRLTARGIVPVILPGSGDGLLTPDSVYLHEAFSRFPVLRGEEGPLPVTVPLREQSVQLYPLRYRGPLAGLPQGRLRGDGHGAHLGLVHLALTDAAPDDAALAEIVAGWGLDYVACGPAPSLVELKSGERLIGCFTGSPEGRSFRENGPRFCASVTLGRGQAALKAEYAQRRSLEVRSLPAQCAGDLDAAVRQLKAWGSPDLLLRVELGGALIPAFDPAELQRRCRGDFFHLEISDGTDPWSAVPFRTWLAGDSPLGLSAREAERLRDELTGSDRAVLDDALRLMLRSWGGGER